MKFVRVLERVYVAAQLTLYVCIGLGPLLIGICTIYNSQLPTGTRSSQFPEHLGLGIIITIVGCLLAWSCLVKGVELYRAYKKS